MEKAEGTDPLNTPVQYVKGVGPAIASLLEKKGVHTVADLFYYFPHRYLDRRQIDPIHSLSPGKERCVVASVVGGSVRYLGRTSRRIYEMAITDGTGVAVILFFHFREAFLKKQYPVGKKILVAGECQTYGGQKQFLHPEIEDWLDNGKSHPIVPVYPLTEGLYQKTVRKIMANAIKNHLSHLEETPLVVRATGEEKISLKESIEKIHLPPENADLNDLNLQRTLWHQRLFYDELFYLQLGLTLKKKGYQKEKGYVIDAAHEACQSAVRLLPFKMTRAQERVLEEIKGDFLRNEPMNRLLQGDVGSGKTLVAFLSAVRVAKNGYQTALMAPTEILSAQHFSTLKPIADKVGIRLALLTSSTKQEEKERILNGLKTNEIQIVIGTHALIQEGIGFFRLAFIVIDEQQRFGVRQRALLKSKSTTIPFSVTPHILVMSATPIPRTLTMTLYGDLDISILDELPAGRRPIETRVYHENNRDLCYRLILNQLREGRQVYFICPLIEASEKSDLKNVTEMCRELKMAFPKYRVELMHGKQLSAKREEVMAAFRENKIQILVSTTVIEVGVDVPNATVMVIEHAERFGLSQLHQLRGRVGRGGAQSYCLLIAGYAKSEEGKYRLTVMESTNDGFKIAEEDLKLRGSGDVLGTRQSGLPTFRLAHLAGDSILVDAARKRAQEIVATDPSLQREEHRVLKKILLRRWEGKLNLANIS